MQRWAIELDGQIRRRLTPEHLELGTPLKGANGRSLLVFRDRFVGLRVASALGTELTPFEEPLEPVAG